MILFMGWVGGLFARTLTLTCGVVGYIQGTKYAESHCNIFFDGSRGRELSAELLRSRSETITHEHSPTPPPKPPNRVYLVNGDDTEKSGVLEAQVELSAWHNRV